MNAVRLFLIIAAAVAAATDAPKMPANPTVLEISTRPWLYAQGVKSLREMKTSVFSTWKKQGIDMVWFMGVWQVGNRGIQHDRTDSGLIADYKKVLPDYTSADAIGSPYAITEYKCNKELCPGGDSDLKWLREQLHKAGLALMLDFVPNHGALDSPLVNKSLDYFVRAPKGKTDKNKYSPEGIAYGSGPYCSPWTDVAQFNYFNENTRTVMRNNLMAVAALADGVRCDMAYIVINKLFADTWKTELASWGYKTPSTEFWPTAIKNVKAKYPKTVFLAEVYGEGSCSNLRSAGFDYTYDKELLDRLKSGHMDNIRGWINSEKSALPKTCHFVENHDESRAMAVFSSAKMAMSAATISMSVPGMRFYFQNQFDGYKNKLDVHLRRAKKESANTAVQSFYNSFLSMLNTDVFRNGSWGIPTIKGDAAWKFVAYTWTKGTERRVVVVNFSQENASCQVVLPDAPNKSSITITELFTGKTYTRNGTEMRSSGLTIVLDAFSQQVFKY